MRTGVSPGETTPQDEPKPYPYAVLVLSLPFSESTREELERIAEEHNGRLCIGDASLLEAKGAVEALWRESKERADEDTRKAAELTQDWKEESAGDPGDPSKSLETGVSPGKTALSEVVEDAEPEAEGGEGPADAAGDGDPPPDPPPPPEPSRVVDIARVTEFIKDSPEGARPRMRVKELIAGMDWRFQGHGAAEAELARLIEAGELVELPDGRIAAPGALGGGSAPEGHDPPDGELPGWDDLPGDVRAKIEADLRAGAPILELSDQYDVEMYILSRVKDRLEAPVQQEAVEAFEW